MLTDEQLREARTRATLRAERFNEVFFRFFRLFRLPRFYEILLVFLIVFWALPEAGHQILLRNNYYGLGNSPIFSNGKIDCADFSEEKPIPANIDQVIGRFLGVYPYRAYAIEMCTSDNKNQRMVYRHEIVARKPHTFITNWAETLSEIASHEIIYFRKTTRK